MNFDCNSEGDSYFNDSFMKDIEDNLNDQESPNNAKTGLNEQNPVDIKNLQPLIKQSPEEIIDQSYNQFASIAQNNNIHELKRLY